MAHCPHLPPAAPRRDQNLSCVDCDANGPDLWICLHNDCSYVGCSENDNNHSFDHYKNNLSHCVQMAISGKHVWCFECKVKIVPYSFNTIVGSNMQDSSNYSNQAGCNINNTSGGLKGAGEKLRTMTSLGLDRGPGLNVSGAGDSQESSDVDDEDALDCNYDGKPRGLVGLQNIGNTCYMNSAIQALSNIPPLTQYFLDCSAAIDFFTDSKKPGLSRSYQKLVKEMWNKRTRGYVVPNSILYGIRNVHPMFRGYHQHDTQEFLRCFMDQLHEELKEPTREEKPVQNNQVRSGYITRQPLQQNLSNKHNGKESGQNMNKSRISHKLTSTTGSKNKEINNERGRGLNRPQRSPARSYDNIPSATANRYYRVHTQSENVENGADFMHGHRRSASYCDPRGYIQLPQEFKGESPSSSPRPSSPLECMDQESSEREFDDDDEETYETCDSGVSDSASLSGEDACSPRNKGFKRKNESESTEKHANEDVVMESNTPGSSQFRSVISDVFDGRLLSSVQCLTCDRISTRVETFQDLSLPIPSRDHMAVLHSGGSSTTGPVSGVNGSPSSGGRGAACSDAVYSATLSQEGWVWWLLGWLRSWFYGPAVTLHDCLAAFFSADELKGDNMYSCEKCNKLRNGVKFSKVLGLPEVLCVHLKRFRHELSSSTKIGAKVSFPLTGLDMRPYLHKDCSSQVSTYELVAVICHAGTAGGGHYTCVARNRHANRWFEFDDQYVTSYSPEQVAGCEAYVLFYKKTNPRMAALRQKAMELLETSNELNDMKFYISKQWINRFNTYAEPGPIDNRDFLCPHGGVSPERDAVVERLTAVVSQPLWEFLYENFGGGPVCNHLHSCLVCCAEVEKLRKRQRTELEHFTILHKNFLEQESVPCIYAISMNWFRIWQAFARNKSQQPPPPIDNTGIIKTSQDNNSKSGNLPIIKPGSDYAQLNEELWNFFHDIYDGGPEVKLKSSNLLSSDYSGPTFTHTVTASNSSYGPSVYGNYSETSGYQTTPILYSRPSDANFGTSRKESDSDENYCVDGHYTKSLSNVDLFNVANKYDASSNTTCVKGTQSLQDVSVRNHISNAVNCLPQHNSHHPVIDKEENQTMLVETSVGVVDHPVRKISYSKDNQIKLKSWRDSSSDDSEYQVNKNVPKKRNLGRKSYRVSETIRPSNVDDSATDTFRQNSQREDYPADKSSISNKDDSTIISNHCQEYNSSCETGNYFNSNSSKSNSSPKSNKMKTTNSSQEINVSDMHTELPSIENIPIKSKTEPSPGVHQNANKSGGNKQRKLSYGKKMKRQQNASGHKKGNSNNVGSQGQGEFTPVVNGGEKIAK